MSIPVNSDELKKIVCPKCGKEMSHGYIIGKGFIRWAEKEKKVTRLNTKSLRKKIEWLIAPNVEAVKCERCKIGLFRYDY